MICRRCNSTNLTPMAETHGRIKRRGCLSVLFHIFMTVITFGLWIIIPLLIGGSHGKITTKTVWVCNNCGLRQ